MNKLGHRLDNQNGYIDQVYRLDAKTGCQTSKCHVESFQIIVVQSQNIIAGNDTLKVHQLLNFGLKDSVSGTGMYQF